MNYAIIAAGEGSRLAAEGIAEPKPLVKIHGETLIDRLLRIFLQNDAEAVFVICNDKNVEVGQHLSCLQKTGLQGGRVPLRFIEKATPSSMHSFFELSKMLPEGPFVLTTVDTIFAEEDFKGYLSDFRKSLQAGFTGVMGVTDYVDDEKPLYVETDKMLNINGFHDDNSCHCRYISAGIYGLNSGALNVLKHCMERQESRMRNFQRALIREGQHLRAYPFTKVLDIDHATDIQKAEDFLQ